MTVKKFSDTLEEDFESYDDMDIPDIDAPTHLDDIVVGQQNIPTHAEDCPNPKCSEVAVILFEVSVGHEFRQCVHGCGGTFRLIG